MEKLRVAVATDDGVRLMGRHFGDAETYEIHEISATGSEHVGRIVNNVGEEEGHADPKKAKGIGGLLKKKGVQVTLAQVFGPNIKRIRKHFVCVLTRHEDIKDGLDLLVDGYQEIVAELKKGEERGFLDWRHQPGEGPPAV